MSQISLKNSFGKEGFQIFKKFHSTHSRILPLSTCIPVFLLLLGNGLPRKHRRHKGNHPNKNFMDITLNLIYSVICLSSVSKI